jgi:gliding motility-associated-like protein
MRKITLLLFTFFFTSLGFSQLPLEGFEGTFPPASWAVFDIGVGGTTDWSTNTNSCQGVFAAYMNRQNIGAGVSSAEYLSTPSVPVPANGELRFFSRSFTAGNAGTIYEVRLSPATSPQNDPASYTTLLASYTEDQLSAVFNVCDEHVINLAAYAGQNVYIAFVMKYTQPTAALSGDRWLLDNVQVIEKCLDPTAQGAAPLATTANLTWTSTAANFEIENILGTGAPTGVATGTSSTNSFTQTGLTPNTNYCYYVRAVCANSSSDWVGPFCYTTSTLPPVCGGNFTDPGGSTGNYANNLNVTTTICPDNATDLVTVTFTSFATEACCDDLTVYAGTGTGGTVLGTFAGNAIPPEITSAAPGQCLTFVFSSDGSVTAAGWVANVTCGPAPTCPKPTSLVTSAVTSTNATVAWTNNSTATTFHVLALPCGSPAPNASTTGWVSTTNNPYTFTTLNPDTCYTLYVRAECSGTDISDWSQGVNITTQPVPPACGGTFTDPGGSNANYANNLNVTTTICPDNATDLVTVTFLSFATEACCDDLIVYAGTGTGGTVLGTFAGNAIPDEITSSAPGQCLTFVFTSDGSVTAAGWVANVTCGPAPTCPKPTALITSTITSTNATLAWTNNSTATTFHVIALPCGSPVPDASTTGWISTTNNPYIFTGLNPDTCYTLYVRAECSGTDISNWSQGANITTQIAPPVCGGIFTDPAGSTVNYANNTNSTVTICPTTPGEQVTVIFTSFQTENNFDGLYVYDGNSTIAPSVQIPSANGPGFGQLTTPGAFWGNLNANLPGPFTASGPTGCLTFQFISDGSVNNPGWVANVLCLPPPTCAEPISLTATNITTTSALLSWTQPLNPDNSTATTWEVFVVPAGSPIPIGNQAGAITTTTNPFLVTGLLSGTNYTYYVRAVCSTTDQSLWSTGFNFSTLIINDNCDGAIFAPVNSNAYCNLTIDGSISGATPSNVPLAPCVGTADDDSWFQFIATNSYLNISLQSITGSTNNLNHAVYSGDCNNLTLLYCSDPNSSTANGLVVGQTYFIRIYSNEATPQTVDFTLCISTPSTCETSSTVCNTNYANTTGVTSLGTIGCLFTSPNPTFFTIQIIGNGPINYLLTQSTTQGGAPNLDVDYAAWGPYNSQAEVCAAMGNPPSNPLTGLTTGCSYSAAATENFTIPGALAGQFYVILITNFSNQQGFISLTQTNAGQPGAGVTYCCSDANFTYPSYSFCKDSNINPVVTLGANSEAGVFTSNPSTGLVFVSTATGEIDLAASATGNYIITNTLAATTTCDERTFSYTIQITDPQTATLSYAETVFCNTDTTLEPAILTGSTTGNYSSSPSGLFINANTGEINPSLSNPGVYNVVYTIAAAGGCPTFTTQPVQIEIIATPNIPQIQDVNVCDSFTLPQLAVGNYYTESGGLGTQLNAGDVISSSQTIYVYAQTNTTPNCTDEESFVVTITPTPQVDVLPNISICSSYSLPTLTVGNYYTGTGGTGTQLNAGDTISSTQTIYIYAQSGTTPNCSSESNFTVTIGNLVVTAPASGTYCDTYTLPTLALGNYFTGTGGTGTQLSAGDAITSTQTIYVYAVDGTCTAEDQFSVTIVPTPQADTLPNVSQCGNYILPTLTVGNYFTGTGGTGTQLNAGDTISSTQTIYIYAQSGTTPNCFTETSFTVTIGTLVVTAPASGTYCDTYTLPALALGNYFTGIGGTGTQLNAGDTITSTQTIYVYAVDGTCTAEDQFSVTIVPTPQADTLPNVSQCGNYILPTLTVGNYFTGTAGTGTQLNAGDAISSTQTIYIYAQSGTTPNCFTETSFTVTIGTLVVTAPASGSYCGSYTLPALTIGNYFTGTGGTGTQLNAGDTITSTQTIYVYAVDGTCTDEESFTVTINSIVADNLADVFACDSYTLPALSSGNNYYTGTNGTGTQISAGTVITATQTLYVYAQTGTTPNCTDEQDFVVTIYNTPTPDAPTNVVACDSYTLPALSVGNYYTQPNGGGTMLSAGSSIATSQTIYVYAQSATTPNCSAENSFTVTINSIVAQTLQNVASCDSYVLQSLNANNSYYTGTGGTGTLLNAGDVITSTQTIYVYAQSGTSPNCTDESSFTVTVTQSPIVQPILSVNACDSYTLPALSVGNYFTGSNGTGSQLPVGTLITSSQTIYVYAQSGTTPNCTDQESFVVTVTPSPVFEIQGDCIGPVFTLFIAEGASLPENAQYQWYFGTTPLGSDATQVITEGGSYSCTITSVNGCPTTMTYNAEEVACIIPKGISPNGDGDNDRFDLRGFNVSQLNIYNRYGTIVYSKAEYVDEWYGQSDKGDELPDGTYYYVIERANSEAKTGWVYINRNAN